jgi:hypothetical protein
MKDLIGRVLRHLLQGGKPIKILRESSWPPHQKCNLEFPESEGV